MDFLVHTIYYFIENENNKEEHGICHYALMFLWRILMAIFSGIFSSFFINFLIKFFVDLSCEKSIEEEGIFNIIVDKLNLFLAILLSIIFILLTFFFLLLGFIELKNMFGALSVRGTTYQDYNII